MLPDIFWQILLLIVAALAYVVKRRADAQLVEVRSHATQMEKQVEIYKAQVEQSSKLTEIIGTSLRDTAKAVEKAAEVNEKTVDRLLGRLEKKDEEIAEDQAYTNEYLRRIDQTVIQIRESARESIKTAQEATQAALKMFAGELTTMFAEQFNRHDIKRDMPPFPDSYNPNWREVKLVPITPDVRLRQWPFFWDEGVSEAGIKAEGEIVRLLNDPHRKGWYAVHKKWNGNPPAWGWVPEHTVKIVEAEQPT